MREIKLRAFDTNHKPPRMVQSSLVIWEINGDLQFRQGEIPMQYTGLKDKNGKEIYEGDIVREECCSPDDPAYGFYGEEYEVRWSTYNAGFDLAQGDNNWPKQEDGYSYSSGLNQAQYKLEVIGNIYENPELLEVVIK